MYDVNFSAWHLEKINSGEPAFYILSQYSIEPSFFCLLVEESGAQIRTNKLRIRMRI
jgi:hypothetical protein